MTMTKYSENDIMTPTTLYGNCEKKRMFSNEDEYE